MKKKAVIWIVIIAVFAAALAAVIIIRRHTVGTNDERSFSISEKDVIEAEQHSFWRAPTGFAASPPRIIKRPAAR